VLIIKLMGGIIFLGLAGCAAAPDKGVGDPVAVEAMSPDDEKTEKLTAISPEVMYLLMTAEIAGQRNRYGVALDGYLEAAKRVDDVRVAERAAKIGLFLKDTEKTTEAVSLWLDQDGHNLTARKIAVLSALKGNDKALAVEHLNKMLLNDPAGFEGTLLELAGLLGKQGRADFIYNVLEGVAEKHPDQAVVFFVQAMLSGQLNKTDIARDKVNKALEIQPEWDKALVLSAQLFAQNGQFELAQIDLEKILTKSPDNNKVRKMLGQVLMKNNALDQAEAIYKKVLKTEVEDGESQLALALIYLQQKKEQSAVSYLKKLVNRRGWGAQASFYLGRIAFKNEQYDQAITWFDKVTKGPYVYEASMAAVSVLLEKNDFSTIESRLAVLLDQFPLKQINILLLKAEVYTRQKKYQAAFDALSEGLVDFPGHRDLLYGRALVAEKLNRLDLLEADLKQILLKDPKDVAVLNALGYTLVDRTERYQEAEEYLLKALQLSPDNALIMDSVGWLRFKQGRPEAALLLLRSAYEIHAQNEIAVHLAEVLRVLGNFVEAESLIERALKKTPNDEYLLKYKQRFPNNQ